MEHNNTQQNNQNDIEKNVFDKINSGEIKMRPKYIYILKVTLLIGLVFLVLTTSAVLISFIIFSLRVSGRLFLLGFGFRGLVAFFLTFPWFILLIDILFIVAFQRLLNHFRFGYRNPFLYTLGASAIIIVAAGFILDHASLHETLFHEAEEHRLGPVGGVYTEVRLPPRQSGVFRGIVSFIATTSSLNTSSTSGTMPPIASFTMRRDDEDPDTDNATNTAMIWDVFLPPGVVITNFLEPGDVVLVAGDVGSGTIRAYGIKKIQNDDDQ